MRSPTFFLVAIGASAGGLDALKRFITHLPENTGLAFVVLTHQKAGRTSMLPELLVDHTNFTIELATDGESIQPNHIYINPPDGLLGVANGKFTITLVEEKKSAQAYHPIDFFFSSMAQQWAEKSIAIILSGSGMDGTIGLQTVKALGGMVIAEDPSVAGFAGMPASAIATGMTDYVAVPEAMPQLLVEYISAFDQHTSAPVIQPTQIPGAVMDQIFALLKTQIGHDFSLYKMNTLQRRIERRMELHQIATSLDYLNYLRSSPHEVELLFRELLIRVTCFFRDSEVWDFLANGPLKEMIASAQADDTVRIWVPGCATGEEAYSIAIIVSELMELADHYPKIQIFATDLDDGAINIARKGRYPQSIEDNVSAERLKKYFIAEEGHFRIRKEIREMMVFAIQNLAKDPPFTRMDLISCRNLLIYMQAEMQRLLYPILHYALKPGALLVLGPSESIGDGSLLFDTISSKFKIYRRGASTESFYLPLGHKYPDIMTDKLTQNSPASHAALATFPNAILKLLVSRYAPVCVVTNLMGEIYYIQGRAGDFLEPNEGRPRNNILEMAREGLRIELASAFHETVNSETRIAKRTIKINRLEQILLVEMSVERIQKPETLRGLILVTFAELDSDGLGTTIEHVALDELSEVEVESPVNTIATDGNQNNAEVVRLKRALSVSQESYQNLVEQLETSNEELKTTNEELQSTNEELQSTNEELETSKEEMQSLNEELATVNNELHAKLESLSQASDDMQNLLNSTDIATIFLDDDLCVKRFTASAHKLIALRNSDIGRPIGELASNLDYKTLSEDGREVLKTLSPKDIEIVTSSGDWFMMRMQPYRTTENVINGLVCTFIDINPLKQAEKNQHYLNAIIDGMPYPMVVVSKEFVIEDSNQSFADRYFLPKKALQGRLLLDLHKGAWNVGPLVEALDLLVNNSRPFQDLVIKSPFADEQQGSVSLHGRMLTVPGAEVGLILIAINKLNS